MESKILACMNDWVDTCMLVYEQPVLLPYSPCVGVCLE